MLFSNESVLNEIADLPTEISHFSGLPLCSKEPQTRPLTHHFNPQCTKLLVHVLFPCPWVFVMFALLEAENLQQVNLCCVWSFK